MSTFCSGSRSKSFEARCSFFGIRPCIYVLKDDILEPTKRCPLQWPFRQPWQCWPLANFWLYKFKRFEARCSFFGIRPSINVLKDDILKPTKCYRLQWPFWQPLRCWPLANFLSLRQDINGISLRKYCSSLIGQTHVVNNLKTSILTKMSISLGQWLKWKSC